MEVNQATGEVTGEIGGQIFRFHATLPRVANLQAALGVTGFVAMIRMLEEGDVRAIYQGLRTLCSSGNAAAFDGMIIGRSIKDALELVRMALLAGLPEGEDNGKKEMAGATIPTPSPGRDTGK